MVEQDQSFTKGTTTMPQELLQAIVPAARYFSEIGKPESIETEVLFGEKLRLIEPAGSHLLVQSSLYSIPGYVLASELARSFSEPTHRITTPFAAVYKGPGFKSGNCALLSLNAQGTVTLRADTPEGEMLRFEGMGWVFADQTAPIDVFQKDYVDVMCSRIGPIPYVWGGRFYPDCSALVMDALLACNIPCPRNVMEQAARLGVPIEFDNRFSDLRRGDFVFWTQPGTKARHVVTMIDTRRCVHATIGKPHHRVVELPLAQVIKEEEEQGNGRPTMVRRIPNFRFR